MTRFFVTIFFVVTMFICLVGCTTRHKVESTHEIKPMHLTIDINLKIQRELNEKFAKRDEIERNITKEEAERALNQYLAEKKE